MTDGIHVKRTSIPQTTQAQGSARPASLSPVAAGTATPNAPATELRGALARPTALSDEGSVSSANIGQALNVLSAAKTLGPRFKFVNMSEAEAVAATMASLSAIKTKIQGAGFAATRHGFAPSLAFKDEIGRANVRLDRTYDGVPIFGSQVITHLGVDGKVADITNGTLPERLVRDTTPSIDEASAMNKAVEEFGAAPKSSIGPKLVIVKTDDGVFHLAFHVVLAGRADDGSPRKLNYFVDAHDGTMLPLTFDERGGYVDTEQVRAAKAELAKSPQRAGFAAADTKTPTPSPTLADGTGDSVYSGVVTLATEKADGKFVLRDPSPAKTETRDALGGEGGGGPENRVFTDDDNKWGGANDDPRVRAGVDAHYAAVNYLTYLKEMFGRNSIDDKGLRLLSNVHVRENFVNAYWDDEAMNYGDGDGMLAGPMVDRDIGGHEITHGLTSYTSRLIYRGESGALNEAGSDVIGSAGMSWFIRGGKDQGVEKDYLLGEDSFTPGKDGDAWRYMDNPTRDKVIRGKNYSRDNYGDLFKGDKDNGGVHINSGIANNFFFLLAAGGTNSTSGKKVELGVGMEKALRIYYRAHTVYFTPETNFAAARVAWLKAATDLFGADSTEVKTVAAAALAVGIEATASAGGLIGAS